MAGNRFRPDRLGIGLALVLTTDAVVSAVSSDRAGAASAVSETAYELGVALGIAILGSLHAFLYRAALATLAATGAISHVVRSSLAAAVEATTSLSPAQAQQTLALAKAAFVDAMQATTGVMAAVMALAALVAWRVIPNRIDAPTYPHLTPTS